MFADSSMSLALFASEVSAVPEAGFDASGIERLWKWYSEEVLHPVVFNPVTVACDWIQYRDASTAVRDLNEFYVKDLVRKDDGTRLTEMDIRNLTEGEILELMERKLTVLECSNGSVLVCIGDC